MTNSTNTQTKLAFCWQGISGRYGQWQDGLYAAMKRLEKKYTVSYHEPGDYITPDAIVLYWEAPVTAQGKDADNYNRVRNLPNKKILLFAGGPIKKEWSIGFDLFALESKINEKECDDLNIPWIHAFGINTSIFTPLDVEKKYKSICYGTCASWKRQGLFGEALQKDGVVCGRGQETDPMPFIECRNNGCTMFDELPPIELNKLVNESHCSVNCADYWGGGQRQTLESLAAGIPVICMDDSPKNREFIEASGCGIIVYPNKEEIRKAVDEVMLWSDEKKKSGIKYVRDNFSETIYAQQLDSAIKLCLK